MEERSLRELLCVPPDKELEGFLKRFSDGLDADHNKKDLEYVWRFASDDALYSIAPTSRLNYIQDKMAKDGIKDFDDVDSHFVAGVMQAIYDIDMNCDPVSAFIMSYSHFKHKAMEELGLIKLEGKMMKVNPDSELAKEYEKLPEDEKKRLQKKAIELHKNINETHEKGHFGLHADVPLPEELKFPQELLKKVYREKLGEPTKGKYNCPVPKKMVDFCRETFAQETGIEIADELRILIGYGETAPFLHITDIVVPQQAMADEYALAQCIIHEMPHLKLKGSDALDMSQSVVGKKSALGRMAWHEGVGTRLSEKANVRQAKYNDEGLTPEIIKKGIEAALLEPRIEMFQHPILVQQYGAENMVSFGVYYSFSYPYGWHFVRNLNSEDFKSLLKEPEPWNSTKLGWNRPLQGKDLETIREYFQEQKEHARIKYRPNLPLQRLVMSSYEKLRRDLFN